MQFEKIRRKNKGIIIVGGLIGIGVIGAVTILPSFAKYRLTESINIVNGTVNYKVPDLKVMAMYTSEDGTNYTEITTMPESGYGINEEKTYCTTDNVNQVKGKIKTVNGEITLKNLTKSDKCYLYFDKIKITDSTSLIVNSKINVGSPDFSKIATTDEGIYATYDNMYGGQSYYFRGAVTNNYVKFANLCWRIVRINGDKTVRLIYDGTTCHANGANADSIAKTSQAYNASYDRSEYVGYTYSTGSQRTTSGTASNLKTQTESWYKTNITDKGFDGKVATGKFCNDRNTASGYTWNSQPSSTFYYAEYDRSGAKSATSVTPTLSCGNASDVYSLKAGAITMDEVIMAGAKWGPANSSYYLYNGQYYWTMSPYHWDGTWAYAFIVHSNGSLAYTYVSNAFGVRPVINLVSGTQFKEGTDGTQSNPYEVL